MHEADAGWRGYAFINDVWSTAPPDLAWLRDGVRARQMQRNEVGKLELVRDLVQLGAEEIEWVHRAKQPLQVCALSIVCDSVCVCVCVWKV